MPLPEFMQIEAPVFAPRRTLSLLETEQFLLLAAYHLWRDDVWPIDGEALDKLRGALSPHPVRDQNKQFGMNVVNLHNVWLFLPNSVGDKGRVDTFRWRWGAPAR